MSHPLRPASVAHLLVTALLVALATALLGGAAASAQDQPDPEPDRESGPVVDILELSGPIDPPVVAAIADLLDDAERRGAALVVLTIDAAGAVAVDVEDVVAPLRASPVPVAVLVGPGDAQAAGGATFLLAAAHIAAAAPTAVIGPACPVTATTDCDDASDTLAAELLGVEATDLTDAGWPAGEPIAGELAADGRVVDLVVGGIEPLLVELDGTEVVTAGGQTTLRLRADEVTVRLHKLGLLRRTLHASLSPTFVYLLVIAVLLLAAFELFQPGFGVAGVAAILLAPLAVYGLIILPVTWWALALVLVGTALLAVDLAVAGLGVPTALGTAALVAGSWWLFDPGSELLRRSPWVVGFVVAACVIFFVVVMTVVLRAQAGPAPDAGIELVGRVGVVRSTMNPEGHVFVDGALWRARWEPTPLGSAGTEAEDAVAAPGSRRRRGREGAAARTGTVVQVLSVDGPVLVVGPREDAGEGSSDHYGRGVEQPM